MDSSYIVLKELAGNAPPTLNPIQAFMAPHVHAIIQFWIAVWFFTAFVVLFHLVLEYRRSRRHLTE